MPSRKYRPRFSFSSPGGRLPFYAPSSSVNNSNSFVNRRGCSLCGVCQVCTCLRWGFVASPTGIIKSVLTVISLVCQTLCLWFGSKYSSELGASFQCLVSAASASAIASPVFLAVYLASESTFYRVRPSLFEFAFASVLAVVFLVSSSCLTYSVHRALFFFYHTVPGFHAYPAMVAAYVCGFVSGLVHAIDAAAAFRQYRAANRRGRR